MVLSWDCYVRTGDGSVSLTVRTENRPLCYVFQHSIFASYKGQYLKGLSLE